MFRIGQGYDVHRFQAGRRLVLGGVEIPHEKGLEAHSDGDVVLHAVSDAMLGAIAAGDIGQHFPDSDPAWKGADSRHILRAVVEKAQDAGYQLVNLDVTVLAQAPKLAPWIPVMRERMAADLGLAQGAVSVKATTTERLGFVGREEGLAAMAIVLLHSEA